MMRRGITRTVSLWLALALVLALPWPVLAGSAVESSSTQTVTSNSSDDDDDGIGAEVTLGLFLVVIAVLLWVGFKSDLAWFSADKDAENVPITEESRPEFFVDMGELSDDSSATLAEEEYDFAGRVGFQMRF